jgi:hypothetical protein
MLLVEMRALSSVFYVLQAISNYYFVCYGANTSPCILYFFYRFEVYFDLVKLLIVADLANLILYISDSKFILEIVRHPFHYSFLSFDFHECCSTFLYFHSMVMS